MNESTIEYFRISVTDRCNFRCVYCMPEHGIIHRSHAEILTYDEITAIVKMAMELGVKKIRLSGGEPLVRKNIVSLVQQIGRLHHVEDFALTTNAALLDNLAEPLKDAGLHRLNISIDTLDPDRFASITNGGDLEKVLTGVHAAQKAGFSSIKINTVMIKGFNDAELFSLLKWSQDNGFIHRFIELMPVGHLPFWNREKIFTESEARAILEKQGGFSPRSAEKFSGPARYYTWEHTGQTVGFISPVTNHFCAACNRLRMTADGRIRMCLFSAEGANIRDVLRYDGLEAARSLLQSIMAQKRAQNRSWESRVLTSCTPMNQLGG